MAGLLKCLHDAAKRGWIKNVGELEYAPRVANRYLKVAALAAAIGPDGSDLLRRLPNDPHNLEWIAKLDAAKLGAFVAAVDCRREDRPGVIKAVKQALGLAKPAKSAGGDDLVRRKMTRLRSGLDELLDRVVGAPEGAALRSDLRQALAEALGRIDSAPAR